MPLILGANSVSGGYNVANSLRFNGGSSDFLNRTPSTSGNLRTWTWSAWIKFSKLATNSARQYLFSASDNTTDTAGIYYGAYADQTLSFESGAISLNLRASANLFRDVSAWYHIVAVLDTTQATSTNRAKLYVNNTLITSYTSLSNYPAQNADGIINSTGFLHSLGSYYGINHFSDNYLSETYLIDGQALDPTYFGETDQDTNIWIPKAYTGTYGTNGFYLEFQNSASLGTDSSGNGNTFTVNNLTSVDQSTDTPTNNFCTLNSLDNYYASATFSEGNLKIATSQSAPTLATIGVSTGKWYWEVKPTVLPASYSMIGISPTPPTSTANFLSSRANEYSYYSAGNLYFFGGSTGTYASYTVNDIIGVALDLNNNRLFFSKNGTFQNSADPTTSTGAYTITAASSTSSGVYFPALTFWDTSSGTFNANFGSPMYSANSYTDGAGYGNFSYAVPSGYYSLNTKNLANFG